jgi:hypothetical protein
LSTIPNSYIHFGDIDLAGIAIYWREYYPIVLERGKFFIPKNLEQHLVTGSKKRFDDQLSKYRHFTTGNDALDNLVQSIKSHRKTVDQEKFITP